MESIKVLWIRLRSGPAARPIGGCNHLAQNDSELTTNRLGITSMTTR